MRTCLGVLLAILLADVVRAADPAATLPENLARRATATASSEYSSEYGAKFACDGQIPAPGAQDDLGRAWVAKGNSHPGGVSFTLTWPQPVTIAEVVYYGRTGWVGTENWKDYELRLDDAATVVVKGSLRAGHGPQRISLPAPMSARKLTIRFLNSFGGPNPGASEIEVYATKPPAKALPAFIPAEKLSVFAGGGGEAPPPPAIPESPQLASGLKTGQLGFTKLLVIQRYHINSSHVYTYHCEGQRNGGGLFILDVADGSLRRLLDSTDGQIQSCDLSHDGRTVVFGWRKGRTNEPYQLYTINIDGTGLRQLTSSSDGHNYDGAWLPDGRLVYLSSRISQAAYCFFTPVGILHTMNADGSDRRRISANYLNDFTPAVTNDGRVIYGRWEYVDRPAIPIQSLWTINPDGTMLQGFFGNRVLDPATFIEPQAIPGTGAILCTMTGHNGSCRGAIGIIDRTYGDNAQEGIRNITPEVRLRGVTVSSNGPGGPYQTPYPLDQRYFLVSHDGTLLLRDYDRTEQAIVLAPRDGLGFYNPRPMRSRIPPPIRVPLAPVELADNSATLYLQDVYNGLEPQVQRGEVKQLAVVQELSRALISSPGIYRPLYEFQRVLVSCGATYVPKKVLGFVDVADDGSAYFRVPARTPIYFIALDAQGRAVQRMRSFTHLMPGETQGCVGCHDSRRQRPRGMVQPSSVASEPQELRPPEWGVRGFDYCSIVQPVLDKHCVQCHNPRTEPKTLDLSGDRTDCFNVSYEMLADIGQGRTGSAYVNWIPTYNGHEWNILEITPKKWGSHPSKLAALVLSGHLDAEGKARVKLGDSERRRILMWIDLNAPYYGTADTAHPNLPACRQVFPEALPKVMNDVFARRCQECHQQQKAKLAKSWTPRTDGWKGDALGLRIEEPQLNAFLLAPLPKSAGGTGRCGKAVFVSKDDPDYQAVLKTFEPTTALIRQTPRMDMPGAKPSACCMQVLRPETAGD